ncbi:MAG: hypothetical protein WA821_07760 [Anaerolineales bacterium]
MRQNTIAVSGPITVIVDNVDGDLQVAGWERAEVSAKTDGDEFDLRVEGDKAYARSGGDLILYLPRQANLQTGNISGDADIRAVSGSARIENVGGDLQMRAVGPVTLNNVSGDLNVRGCAGDFTAEHIGSDASLRDVQGKLKLSTVGADLYLRNTSADIQAQTGADAILYLQPKPGADITVRAGGDILLRLPAAADAELSLQGGSMESIRVDFAGVEPGEAGMTRQVKLGSGAAKIHLTAGDDLIVTSRADEWQSLADFDSSGLDEMFPGNFPGIPADFHEQIAQRVQDATQRAMRAAEQGQRHSDRAQRRVEAAMRRAEEKMRAAERRTKFMGVAVGRRPASPIPPVAPPVAVSEPVSDAERLAVLKMLQDKKISLQDAEKLLAALEGK